jgi:hypothetical protein
LWAWLFYEEEFVVVVFVFVVATVCFRRFLLSIDSWDRIRERKGKERCLKFYSFAFIIPFLFF